MNQTSLKFFAASAVLALNVFVLPESQAGDTAQTNAIADGSVRTFQPTWNSLTNYQCPDWFRDAKFGIWSHWGPQSVPEGGDWYARNMYVEGHAAYKLHLSKFGHPSKVGYKDVVTQWKAEKFDAAQAERLMRLYKDAGARYFVSMGVHHDNFDLWNSKFHKWNAVNVGPRKDIVGMWAEAARQHGLRFGVSEHLERSYSWFNTNKRSDTNGPLAGVPYDGNDPKFADFYFPPHADESMTYPADPPEWWMHQWRDRINDLVGSYHPDLLYTDGGIPFGEVGRSVVADFYNSSVQRNGGRLEAVYTLKQMQWGKKGDHGDYAEGVGVRDMERGFLGKIEPRPWQTDTSIGDWFYNPKWGYRPAKWVVHMLADIVSKNGNLLLNVVQRPDGSLDPQAETLLKELAAWMSINGEAIHGTRPWRVFGESEKTTEAGHFKEDVNYSAKDIRFTTKGESLYAIALGVPQGEVKITALGAAGGGIDSITLLGSDAKLNWTQSDEALTIQPVPQWPCQHAVVFKIKFKK
jgi:alpha-L-fucosidase